MNGPEHYREAEVELLLADSEELASMPDRQEMALRRAHVHAMLAVAAATIDAELTGTRHTWNRVLH